MKRLALLIALAAAGCGNPVGTVFRDDLLMSSGCSDDSQCSAPTPRCNRDNSQCVPCLPANDNCPKGQRCVAGNGTFLCASSCVVDGDCPKSAGGNPTSCCAGACLDTSADTQNCGKCGSVCPAPTNGTAACVGGACAVGKCNPGFLDCDHAANNGCEVTANTDAKNCGACGKQCSAGANQSVACMAGACATSCNTGFADCNGDGADGCEANTGTDARHCGACGAACAPANASAACKAGTCTIGACNAGFADCNMAVNDGCEVDLAQDVNHCGDCIRACMAPHGVPACNLGSCSVVSCNMGFANCNSLPVDGCEVDTGSDAANCGACGRKCLGANSMQACQVGACVIAKCAQDYADCDKKPETGCEVQIGNNPLHCGGCGNACAVPANGVAACTNAACVIDSCKLGFGDCNKMVVDGCEADLASVQHCGVCGNACPAPANATAGCKSGSCGIGVCNNLFGDCDGNAMNGCEKNLSNDVANCGKCATPCSFPNAQPGCLNGQCGILGCNQGFADCDLKPATGCEANLGNDAANCGRCGAACAVNQVCVMGNCVLDCPNQVIDNKQVLCVPAGMTYKIAGDRCYTDLVIVKGTLQVVGFDGLGNGALTLRSPSITVHMGGKIVGDAAGRPGGSPAPMLGGLQGGGAGGGCGGGPGNSVGQGGSGGGYGGAGGHATQYGNDGQCDRCNNPTAPAHCWGAGGITVGSAPKEDVDMGSGGGAGGNSSGCQNSGGRGGAGGGIVLLLAKTMQIDGTVSANGEQPPKDVGVCGYRPGGGGGSGGAVVLRAEQLGGSGRLEAAGGRGGDTDGQANDWGWAGGGGGGGRIKVFATKDAFLGTLTVSGGTGGTKCGGGFCSSGLSGADGSTNRSQVFPNVWAMISCGGL